MKKPLRQNVFSYAYLAGQNVLLKVRNTSAINMGPIRYDTVLSGLGNFVPMNLSPFLKYLLSFGLNMSASSDSGGATRTGSGGGGAAAALVGEESRGG